LIEPHNYDFLKITASGIIQLIPHWSHQSHAWDTSRKSWENCWFRYIPHSCIFCGPI